MLFVTRPNPLGEDMKLLLNLLELLLNLLEPFLGPLKPLLSLLEPLLIGEQLLLSALVLILDHPKLVEKGFPHNIMILPCGGNLLPRILDLFSKRTKLLQSPAVGLFCNALKPLHQSQM